MSRRYARVTKRKEPVEVAKKLKAKLDSEVKKTPHVLKDKKKVEASLPELFGAAKGEREKALKRMPKEVKDMKPAKHAAGAAHKGAKGADASSKDGQGKVSAFLQAFKHIQAKNGSKEADVPPAATQTKPETPAQTSVETEAEAKPVAGATAVKQLTEAEEFVKEMIEKHEGIKADFEKLLPKSNLLKAAKAEAKKPVKEGSKGEAAVAQEPPPAADATQNPPPVVTPTPAASSAPAVSAGIASTFLTMKTDLEDKIKTLEEKLKLVMSRTPPMAAVPMPTNLQYEVLQAESKDQEFEQDGEVPDEYYGSVNRVDLVGFAGRPSMKLWQTGLVAELQVTTTFTRAEVRGAGVLTEREAHRVFVHGETLAHYVMAHVRHGFQIHVQGRLSGFPKWSEEDGRLVTHHAINVHPDAGGAITIIRGNSSSQDSKALNEIEHSSLSMRAKRQAEATENSAKQHATPEAPPSVSSNSQPKQQFTSAKKAKPQTKAGHKPKPKPKGKKKPSGKPRKP